MQKRGAKLIETVDYDKIKEVMSWFGEVEGYNALYYGLIRNGKTFSATSDILDLLSRGEVVYANWKINFEDFDERDSWLRSFLKFFFFKRYYFKYNATNFHYFSPDDVDVDFLGRLVNVHVFIDEGQWLFNSHIRERAEDEVAIAKRRLILHGGHYCRSLNIITQRPVNVFKDMRSQISIWYKCEKLFSFGKLILFRRQGFQHMKNDEPDEELPDGRPKLYFASNRVMNAYNTHGMRAKDAITPSREYEVYELTFKDRFLNLLRLAIPRGRIKRPSGGGEVKQMDIGTLMKEMAKDKRDKPLK